MLALERYNPWRNSLSRNVLDDWFTMPSIFGGWRDEEKSFRPNVDITESETEFKLTAELPGFSKDNVKIEVENGTLKLSAEYKEEKEEKKESYHLKERRYGSFMRYFVLPDNADVEKIDAKSKDGILTITIPKLEPAKTKQIEIQVH